MIGRDHLVLTGEQTRLVPLSTDHEEAVQQAIMVSVPELRRWMAPMPRSEIQIETVSYAAQSMRDWEEGTNYAFAAFGSGDDVIGTGEVRVDRMLMVGRIGGWIRSDATGRGHAKEMARLLTEFGFDTLGLARVEALVGTENLASLAVVRGLGYVYEGRLRSAGMTIDGSRYDCEMLARLQPDRAPVGASEGVQLAAPAGIVVATP